LQSTIVNWLYSISACKNFEMDEQECLAALKTIMSEKEQDYKWEEFIWLLEDDRFLLHFVRGRKYDPTKAAVSLKQYFHVRRVQYKDLFLGLKDPHLEVILQTGVLGVLKTRSSTGHVYGTLRFPLWTDPPNMQWDDFTKSVVYLGEEIWNDEEIEKSGVSFIIDLQDFGMSHARIWGPWQAYKAVNVFFSSMPLRYSKFHLVNGPTIFHVAFKLIKPLLPSKMRKRIVMHNDFGKLHQSISPDMLPTCFGGPLAEEDAFDTDMIERIFSKGEHYEKFVKSLSQSDLPT